MRVYEKDGITLLNDDCMSYLATLKDKAFELAMIDCPYGLGNRLSDGGGKLKDTPMAKLYRDKEWDVLPSAEYWEELFRVTKNQIVHGANYFLDYLYSSRGFVVWDKKQAMPTLSACELIWTSFDCPSKIFEMSSTDNNRFHPTQKPKELYTFLLNRFAKQGDKILDTHGGSFSSAIACWELGFTFVGIEKDEEYFDKAVQRFENHVKQGRLFTPEKKYEPIQETLIL